MRERARNLLSGDFHVSQATGGITEKNPKQESPIIFQMYANSITTVF